MALGKLADGVRRVGFRIEAVQRGGFDQGVEDGGALAACVGPDEQEALATDGHPWVILPMSGKRSSSTIDGILCADAGCAGTTVSDVLAATWFMSRWRRVSS